MSNTKNKGGKEKYSIQNPSPRLLQTLRDIMSNQSGTVNYVFVEDRIEFTKKFPKGKVIKVKSSTSAPINKACFHKEVRGKLYRRTAQELLELFDATACDMGASYFIVS